MIYNCKCFLRIVLIADYVNLNTLPEDIKCWFLERYLGLNLGHYTCWATFVPLNLIISPHFNFYFETRFLLKCPGQLADPIVEPRFAVNF